MPRESTHPVNAAFLGLAFTAALRLKLLGANLLIMENGIDRFHRLPGESRLCRLMAFECRVSWPTWNRVSRRHAHLS